MESDARREETMARDDGKSTWARVKYYVICGGLIVGGLVSAIGGPGLLWEPIGAVLRELGLASIVAGILGLFVEPFFKNEFARDAFLAAFRYVLPDEFKEEIERILRYEFIHR
jgi:hypothetical protein